MQLFFMFIINNSFCVAEHSQPLQRDSTLKTEELYYSFIKMSKKSVSKIYWNDVLNKTGDLSHKNESENPRSRRIYGGETAVV